MLRKHQLAAFFTLTYLFAWTLWLPLKPYILAGRSYLTPLLSLGIFAPALVGIFLSALSKPEPRQGERWPPAAAFLHSAHHRAR